MRCYCSTAGNEQLTAIEQLSVPLHQQVLCTRRNGDHASFYSQPQRFMPWMTHSPVAA
jgi:hypothetical protein